MSTFASSVTKIEEIEPEPEIEKPAPVKIEDI